MNDLVPLIWTAIGCGLILLVLGAALGTGLLEVRVFPCRHPQASLHHIRPHSERDLDENHREVTMHLGCSCGHIIDMKHIELIGGPAAYMDRIEQKSRERTVAKIALDKTASA